MKAQLRILCLDALAVGVTLLGRYGGGVGAWVDALSGPVLDVTRAHARRTAAVEACARALRSVPPSERGQLALEVLAHVGALDGLRADELADVAVALRSSELAELADAAAVVAAQLNVRGVDGGLADVLTAAAGVVA